jgi:hypothetical protein
VPNRFGGVVRRWWLVAWCAVLTVAVMAPLARPGFVLTYDMVSVPDQQLVPEALGLGSGPPRAVPQDAVLALLTTVVPGAAIYRVVLVGVIFCSALGAALLLARVGPGAQAVAATAYAWNAYVAERLVIGHWTVLIAYAVLPWLLRAALAGRHGGGAAAVVRVLLLVALASVTSTGGLLASVVAVLAVAGRTRLVVLAGCVALQLPWLLPALLSPTAMVSDPAGVEVFAARADSPLGLLGGVLTLGGIWNADVVPDSRALVSAAVVTVAWVALALVGARDVAPTLGPAAARILALLAALGLLLALAGTVGGALAWAVEHIPGAGLLRDGHKFLAWYALALAPAVGLGARRLALGVSRVGAIPPGLVMGVAALLPVLALPDLAAGVWGRVAPVEYPAEWEQVRDTLRDRATGRGALVVLPYQPFRSFPWNDHRTALDPFPRYSGLETVVPDELTVGPTRLSGEDPRAAAVTEALGSDDPVDGLLAVGVAWVAVQHDTPGEIPEEVLDALIPVVRTGVLDAYRIPGEPVEWRSRPPAIPVIAADLAVLAVVVVLVVLRITLRVRRSSDKPGTVAPS